MGVRVPARPPIHHLNSVSTRESKAATFLLLALEGWSPFARLTLSDEGKFALYAHHLNDLTLLSRFDGEAPNDSDTAALICCFKAFWC